MSGNTQKRKLPLAILNSITKGVKLFHDPRKRSYAVTTTDGHKNVMPIGSQSFRNWLKMAFYSRTKRLPSQSVLTEFIALQEHRALVDSPEQPTWLRLGRVGDDLYVDLCNDKGEVLKITKESIRVVRNPKAHFLKSNIQQWLPRLKKGKRKRILRKLRSFLNCSPEDQMLIIAWLIGSFNVEGPFPILILLGESGSGKSTVARMIESLIDPSAVDMRSLPPRTDELMIAAEHSWVLSFDNVSFISKGQSDDLCRLSTGSGGTRRKLYENAEQVLFKAKRPMIINGINNVIVNEDLADRAIVIEMKPLTNRRLLKDLNNEFQKMRPYFLNLICEGVRAALANRNKIQISQYPRMADFANWVCAAEKAVFGKDGRFVKAFERNRRYLDHIRLESDPLVSAIKELMERRQIWKGTCEELLTQLVENLPKNENGDAVIDHRLWPKGGNKLSAHLRRIAPPLRQEGLDIQNTRTSKARLVIITNRHRKQGKEDS